MTTKTIVIGIGILATFAAGAQQATSDIVPPQDPVRTTTQSTGVDRISAEEFGALPFMINPWLSPDGKKIATRATTRGQEIVAVVDLEAKSSVAHQIVAPEKYELNWYRWAGNNKVLIGVGQVTKLSGWETYVTRLLMYDLSTKKVSFIGKKGEGWDGDTVIHVARDGSSLLLSLQENIYEYPSVWSVDLETLVMKEVVKQQPNVWAWFADADGVVRAGLGARGRRWWLIYRKTADADFQEVVKRKITKEDEETDIEEFIPINGSDSGYAIANKNTGRFGLYRYDFATDTLGEAVFAHPQVDIDSYRQAENGEIEAVYYSDDRSRIEWLNPRMKQVQADIDKAMPNRINRVTSINRDGNRMVVWTGSASDPGRYYVYHLEAGKMGLFSKPYDKLGGKQLSLMESTAYRARDGLEIPAYLTLPYGREAKALPLVVMPHGGPFMRDTWGYDVYAQFLANRGYAVLQPNFRGSTGYGKDYVEKGISQFGRGMQDDLDDGVKWLVEQGKVDAKRVCIMGGSYGGYAAMWAAARNPEIYRCAISFAGVSDVGAMLKYNPRAFTTARYFRNWRARFQGDQKFNHRTVSPLYSIDRISIPLLIAHGDKDATVPMLQSKKMHEALVKAEKPHEYVIYEGERHGFTKVENSVDYLKRVEAFLSKYNPAD